MGTPSRVRDVLHMADLGRRDRRNVESDYEKGEICRSDICAVGRGRRDGCYVGGYGYSDFRGPAKYQPCQDAYEKGWRDLEWDHPRGDAREMSCDLIPESTRRALQMCPECIDEGSTFVRYDQSCKLSTEHAEKQRKAEEKKRECDHQATEKKNQCLAQPALGSSLGIDNDPKTRSSFFSFDRLKGLQKCQDQYAECLTQHADTRYAECLPHHMLGLTQYAECLNQHNSSQPLNERRHCARKNRRCIELVRERVREQKTEDSGQERSLPHPSSLGNGDRLKGLQECQAQYEDCVSDTHHMPAGGLGQQNSSVTTNEPPDTRLHCAKKHRRCIDRVREREEKTDDRRQRTEDVNIRTSRTEERQPFLQPPLRIAPVDGVHATSFALGALVAFTLSAVAYFVRRPRGTKMTDSRGAYGAATV